MSAFHDAASQSPYHTARRNGIPMLALGAILTLLAIWIFACNPNNEFIGPLFLVALALLGCGLAMP